MMRPLEARYEDGALKLEGPVSLRPGERVSVIVIRRPDAARWNLEQIARTASNGDDLALAQAGLTEWAEALDVEEAH